MGVVPALDVGNGLIMEIHVNVPKAHNGMRQVKRTKKMTFSAFILLQNVKIVRTSSIRTSRFKKPSLNIYDKQPLYPNRKYPRNQRSKYELYNYL